MQGFKLLKVIMSVVALLSISTFVQATSGDDILQTQCVECHELNSAGPASLNELWSQKGPNFSYAGNKYKQEWLVTWLTNPVRIRPAGMFYGNHIKPSDAEDVIDQSTLAEHVVLDAAEAKLVAEKLMKYRAKTELIKAGAYKPGKISLSAGERLFIKFRGCSGCHLIEPRYGGVSGPEVYTVANRLQEDYMMSFMQDPQAWTSHSLMPKRYLKNKDLQNFIHYFKALAKEDF